MANDKLNDAVEAVAQARVALDRYHEAMTYDVDEYLELRDALIASARVEGAREALTRVVAAAYVEHGYKVEIKEVTPLTSGSR